MAGDHDNPIEARAEERPDEERNRLYLDTYESRTPEEVVEAYRRWAPTYEDHIRLQGWRAPELCAALLVEHLLKMDGADSGMGLTVIDVGAGTGLVGRALAGLAPGRLVVDALDLSPEMLFRAFDKNVYRDIHVGDAETMSASSIIDQCGILQANPATLVVYDALICVGALNVGHIDVGRALPRFIESVKRETGLVAFSTRQDYFEQHARPVQEALGTAGAWTLVERREVGLEAVRDMPHIHWLYRRT